LTARASRVQNKSKSKDSSLIYMSRIEATPTPSVLKWARESAGLSIEAAAGKADVKPDHLARWEGGGARPSIPQLRKLAQIYRRPLAAFYLPEPPKRFEVMHDFRRIPTGQVHERTPELALEIRKAYDRREWALELSAGLDEALPDFSARASPGDDIEVTATKLRAAIGITLDAQSKWKLAYEAFRGWRAALERAGILTLQATGVPLEEVRGFSISIRPLPVAVVNIKDSPRGRVFTLLHELTHIALNDGGICDLHDADIEAVCNRTAGAALFPREALLDSPTVRHHQRSDYAWSDDELRDLSRQFGGSREAALVRLLTLKLTTQAFYDRMHRQFLQEYRAQQEKSQNNEGFAPPIRSRYRVLDHFSPAWSSKT
jgi:Zn-dependent peptidase ImmA (M78 family)/DNA-binding transcriptional regulator YiaG